MHESIYDAFMERAIERTEAIVAGGESCNGAMKDAIEQAKELSIRVIVISFDIKEQTVNGHRVIMHDGSWEGFQSALLLVPDADIGLFVSTNSIGGIDADARSLEANVKAAAIAAATSAAPSESLLMAYSFGDEGRGGPRAGRCGAPSFSVLTSLSRHGPRRITSALHGPTSAAR